MNSLNGTQSYHYRTLSNKESPTVERPRLQQRRFSSFDRNEYVRKLYNESNTFIYDNTITTVTNATASTTHVITFGLPTSSVDKEYDSGRNGKEITESFFKNLDNTPTTAKANERNKEE